MSVVKQFSVVDGNSLPNGSLIALEDTAGGSAIGFVSHRTEDQMALRIVVVQTEADRLVPYWIYFDINSFFVSYGIDWVLDLEVGQGGFVGNYEKLDDPGSVVTGYSNVVLLRAAADGSSISQRPTWFDLATYQPAQRSADVSTTVVLRSWKIWLNEAERTRIGGKPIVVFTG